MYWQIGVKINQEVSQNEIATYEKIVSSLILQLS